MYNCDLNTSMLQVEQIHITQEYLILLEFGAVESSGWLGFVQHWSG